MKDQRFLTLDEATLLSAIAERLLRVAEVERNGGEDLLRLLAHATLRPEGCTRGDIAGLNWRVRYQFLDSDDRHELTLACPRDADALLSRASILSPLALSLAGRPVGAFVGVPVAHGQSRIARVLAVWRPEAADDEPPGLAGEVQDAC